MSTDAAILQGERPSSADKQLIAMFDDLEKGQIDFLDQTAKRIIELCTGLLSVLFAVSAFGDKFPPPYLHGNAQSKLLVIGILAFYMLAMLAGLVAILPREYRRFEHNLTEMRRELNRIVKYKATWMRVAAILFVLGSLALAVLIATIIFAA